MVWKQFLKTMIHAALGFGVSYGSVYITMPDTNPVLGAAIGSALTSIVSAMSKSTNFWLKPQR